ncbi:MAG: hypothetical protein IKP72_15000, partial [Clostridia bacterium]|nr:hypothetical protein [Clostridia bacterium]
TFQPFDFIEYPRLLHLSSPFGIIPFLDLICCSFLVFGGSLKKFLRKKGNTDHSGGQPTGPRK